MSKKIKKNKAAFGICYLPAGSKAKILTTTNATIVLDNGSRITIPTILKEGTPLQISREISQRSKDIVSIVRTINGEKKCCCGKFATYYHRKKCFIFKVKGYR